jgi:hypothetical protein
VTVGNVHYFNKELLVAVVEAYIYRKTTVDHSQAVIRFIRRNPEVATKMLELIK